MGLKDSYINDYAHSQLQGARRLAEMAGLLPPEKQNDSTWFVWNPADPIQTIKRIEDATPEEIAAIR